MTNQQHQQLAENYRAILRQHEEAAEDQVGRLTEPTVTQLRDKLQQLDASGTAPQVAVGDIVQVRFPVLNKQDDLIENDRRICDESHRETCRVDKVLSLDHFEFGDVAEHLLDDRPDLWEGIGGSTLPDDKAYEFDRMAEEEGISTDEGNNWAWMSNDRLLKFFRRHSLVRVIAVTSPLSQTFYVNTEGYSYARYVGRAA